jgi:F-type H+-transporting ATPase subunit b
MAGETTHVILLAQAQTPAGAVQAAGEAANAAAQQTTQASVAVPEETPGVFPPFDSTTFASQILWLVITFGVLYWIIARIAVPRIGGTLAQRKGKIDGDLAEADRLRQATDKAIADYEAALAAARTKAQGIAQATRDASKTELDAKRAGVEADLAKKMAAAETSIQKAKTEALGKVDEIAADTAAALVSRLVGNVSADEAKAAVASVTKG